MRAGAGVTIRPPRAADAARVWELLPRIGRLERNTGYAYLLLCTHFAPTGVVAEVGGELAGFVLGYRPPSDPDDLFVWQVGVAPDARGGGLGGRLLDAFVALPAAAGARALTATVSPDNVPSLALFQSFARRHGLPCERGPGFPGRLFAEPHPDEDLLRIGPLPAALSKG